MINIVKNTSLST